MQSDNARFSVRWLLLWILAVVMGLGYAAYHKFPLLDPPHAVAHVVTASVLYVLYAWGVWLVRDQEYRPALLVLIAMGLVYRGILFPLDPSMSDDLYRYLWDGRMQSLGINPYAVAPEAPYLAIYQDGHIHPLINHAHLRTLYPPTSQILFYMSYVLDPSSFLGLKGLLLLAEIATLGLLAVGLRRQGRPLGLLLAYAWCPLPIFELMLDGHLDGFGLPFLVAVWLMVQQKRPWLTGIFYALGLLVKPMGIFVGPLLLWQMRWRGFFKMSIAAVATMILLFSPYLAAGKLMGQQLLHYSQHWYFNGPVFLLLDIWFEPNWLRPLLLLSVVIFAWFVPWLRGLTFSERFVLPLVGYLLLAPTLYPWYVLWVTPWLVLTGQLWLFWFVGCITLAHTVHKTFATTGIWQVWWPILLLEFVPLGLLMMVAIYRHRMQNRY